MSGGDCQSFCREKPGVGIQHLDLAFVGEVYLGFVGYAGQYVARHADAGIAYFETSCTHGGLIFVFGADGSVDFRQVSLVSIFSFSIFFPSSLMEGVWAIAANGSRAISTVNALFFIICCCRMFVGDKVRTYVLCFCVIYVALLLQKTVEGRTAMGAVLIFLWLDLVSCFY